MQNITEVSRTYVGLDLKTTNGIMTHVHEKINKKKNNFDYQSEKKNCLAKS